MNDLPRPTSELLLSQISCHGSVLVAFTDFILMSLHDRYQASFAPGCHDDFLPRVNVPKIPDPRLTAISSDSTQLFSSIFVSFGLLC